MITNFIYNVYSSFNLQIMPRKSTKTKTKAIGISYIDVIKNAMYFLFQQALLRIIKTFHFDSTFCLTNIVCYTRYCTLTWLPLGRRALQSASRLWPEAVDMAVSVAAYGKRRLVANLRYRPRSKVMNKNSEIKKKEN